MDEQARPSEAISRRAMLTRGAVVTGGMWIAPVVQGLSAPAFAAESPRPTQPTATLEYLIGFEGEPPNVARAENGHTMEIDGQGSFTLDPDSASGGGNFVHRSDTEEVLASGDWTATKFLSFESFGPATEEQLAEGLPPGSEGGILRLLIHLTSSASAGRDGVLAVFCHLGNTPPGVEEGITLNLIDVANFDEVVSGANLFIRK